MSFQQSNRLGLYLRDCRAKLDPAAFGLPVARRRTPGLRREEVAQRANVSATWYTWLEQGRGGAPSADVLDRIARALTLTEVEREHLFLLARRRTPDVSYKAPAGVSPRIQRVLDSLELSPAYVMTSTWDIVAWNHAASAVLADYGALAPEQRNILRRIFCDPDVRGTLPNWESVARIVVAAFRADAARAGASKRVEDLVDELSRASPDFEAMWRDNSVGAHGEGTKYIRNPAVGVIALDYSAFVVDSEPHLSMVIFTPVTATDTEKVGFLIKLTSKCHTEPPPGSPRAPFDERIEP